MSMNSLHLTNPRRGFTLIELLTVIAIIGILASILIPTVGAVRQSAHQTRSLSNLRQIALAMNLYADSNQDRFPPGYFFQPGEGEMIWTTSLMPYLGMQGKVYNARMSIFASPLAQIPVRDGNPDAGVMPSTYSVHGLLGGDISGGDNRLPRNQVQRPTQVILVGEGTQRANNTYANASFGNPAAWRTRNSGENLNALIPTESDADGIGGALRYRGRGDTAPVAFVDGHVKSLKKGTVTFGNLIADR
jgi:prepilin-type N-terminal cleavage/methylation domain-containing protein/prepilin-type processing-associated H-X9-DG protein